MPEGPLRARFPSQHATGRTGHQHGTRRELERIPNIKKLAGPTDTMSLEETEQKICQFCHLWQLYADTSVELKKKSELSEDSAVAACRVYVPYMSDITRHNETIRGGKKNIRNRKRSKNN